MIDKLARRANNVAGEELLKDVLEDALAIVCEKSNQQEVYVLKNMEGIVIDVAVEKLNKMGNEGIKAFSASGVSETYQEGLSKDVLSRIYRHRKLVRR